MRRVLLMLVLGAMVAFGVKGQDNKVSINLFLEKFKNNDIFEIDTTFGYIRIGYLFSSKNKNAIMVYDSLDVKNLKIFELVNTSWKEIYSQNNISKGYFVKTYIYDFNFDGIKDLAINTSITNGAAIAFCNLWIYKSELNTFINIPQFIEIGTPTIDKSNKIIVGFVACCAFTEINIKEYFWYKDNLKLKKEINIENYTYKQNANEKYYSLVNGEMKLIKNINRKISDKEIYKLILKYNPEKILSN